MCSYNQECAVEAFKYWSFYLTAMKCAFGNQYKVATSLFVVHLHTNPLQVWLYRGFHLAFRSIWYTTADVSTPHTQLQLLPRWFMVLMPFPPTFGLLKNILVSENRCVTIQLAVNLLLNNFWKEYILTWPEA